MVFWPTREEAARLSHIAKVLFDNHLTSVLTRLKLRSRLPVGKRFDTHKEHEISPRLVLKVVNELDGSFIKLGQLLSLRPDLIPAEYCSELSRLQDNVPPFSGSDAVKIIEKELKKPIKVLFSEFDEKPVASASMGQVHIARLKDGTKVAVKVQRPNIERTVKIDIKLLYRIAGLAKRRFGTSIINPVEIVREFERYTENELNYLKEAHSIDLFHGNFAGSKKVIIPKVFWNHTTSKVLTMEFIEGRRLTDLSKFGKYQKETLIRKILECEFEQIFVHGLFHADPHPGNFLVKRNGRVALLDFGIVGRLDYVLKENMTDFFIALVRQDVDGLVNAAVRLGVADGSVDMDVIRRDIYDRLSEYYGTSLDKINVSGAMNGIIRLFREHNLRVSPNFILLVKATVTLESVAQMLDPKLNFVETAKPFVEKLAKDRLSPKRIAMRARRKVEAVMEFAGSIPGKANALISDIHDTSRDLKRIDRDISMLTVEMDRSSNRITLGFLAGTLFIASTILLPFQKTEVLGIPPLSFAGYVLALIITVSIFISILKEKKI
jgi:ubiquinone biosynthesis protein